MELSAQLGVKEWIRRRMLKNKMLLEDTHYNPNYDKTHSLPSGRYKKYQGTDLLTRGI